jgi:hypothetical protein
MKAEDIKIGKVYEIKVGKNIVPVRVTRIMEEGGWEAISLATEKSMVIKSAERLITHKPKEPHVAAGAKTTAQQTKNASVPESTNTGKPRAFSALDAAAKVLAETGTPLNCKQLIDIMTGENYWQPSQSGKTPSNTLHAAISKEIKVKGDQSRFKKAARGQFALSAAE